VSRRKDESARRSPRPRRQQPSDPGNAPPGFVRLIDPAVRDLEDLARHNPQALRWSLKKMLLLERDPYAGEELHGDLIGWRKLVVGNRDWRIIWRATTDDTGAIVVDIAEVWAVGARSDAAVYREMAERVASLPKNPPTLALAEVIERLGRAATAIQGAREIPAEPVPDWLLTRLVHTAGLNRADVEHMTLEEAVDAWTAWSTSGTS
jgi:mRNA interferase RelE/StbE